MTPDSFDRSRYLSAQQIADLRLTGLPTTKFGINRRANADGWSYIDRPGRGGGRLYAITGLPAEAAADYAARIVDDGDNGETRRGRPRGSDRLTTDQDLREAITAALAERQISARNLAKHLAALGIAPPPMRTLQRFMARIEEEQQALLASVRNPDRYRSKYRLALGTADADATYAHEVWEIDTTKADLMLQEGRKCVLGLIDRYSRRVRFEVVDSESAQSVRRFLINTIRAWGVMPARLKVDNGSGYVNATITTALELLGIVLDPCLPGHPYEKPHVERVFGTFQRDRTSLLGGFVGHNVAQAQELRSRARGKTGRPIILPELSAAEFQGIMDGWLDGEYHVRTHSSLRMTPMQKWQASPAGARRAPDEGTLRLALSAFVANQVVGKRGITWKRGRYWAAGLSAWMGRTVMVRRDEDDLGALFIFDEDGRYIDTAINHERAGMSEQQFAMQARMAHERFMASQKESLREMRRKFDIDAARDKMLRDEAEAARRIVHLTRTADPASTPMIDSVAPQAPVPVPGATTAEVVRLPTPPMLTPFEQMAQTDATLAAADRGETVDPETLGKARIHATSDQYISTKLAAGQWTYDQAREARRKRGRRGVA